MFKWRQRLSHAEGLKQWGNDVERVRRSLDLPDGPHAPHFLQRSRAVSSSCRGVAGAIIITNNNNNVASNASVVKEASRTEQVVELDDSFIANQLGDILDLGVHASFN